MANGFSYSSSHEWANLGQGAPEVGPLPDAPPRPDSIPMPVDSLEYAPTTGVKGGIVIVFKLLKLILVISPSRGRCKSVQCHLSPK